MLEVARIFACDQPSIPRHAAFAFAFTPMMGQTVDQKLERLKESVDAKEDLELELKRDLTLAYDELERERASSRALRQAYSKAEAELARAHEACALAITARNQAADGPAKPTASGAGRSAWTTMSKPGSTKCGANWGWTRRRPRALTTRARDAR